MATRPPSAGGPPFEMRETKDDSTTEVAQFLEVENGKVVSLVEFLDTAYALSMLDKAPAAHAKTEDRS